MRLVPGDQEWGNQDDPHRAGGRGQAAVDPRRPPALLPHPVEAEEQAEQEQRLGVAGEQEQAGGEERQQPDGAHRPLAPELVGHQPVEGAERPRAAQVGEHHGGQPARPRPDPQPEVQDQRVEGEECGPLRVRVWCLLIAIHGHPHVPHRIPTEPAGVGAATVTGDQRLQMEGGHPPGGGQADQDEQQPGDAEGEQHIAHRQQHLEGGGRDGERPGARRGGRDGARGGEFGGCVAPGAHALRVRGGQRR